MDYTQRAAQPQPTDRNLSSLPGSLSREACAICGEPAELTIPCFLLHPSIERAFSKKQTQRALPFCGLCSVKYSAPQDLSLTGDGPYRGWKDELSPSLTVTEQDDLIALFERIPSRYRPNALAALRALAGGN